MFASSERNRRKLRTVDNAAWAKSFDIFARVDEAPLFLVRGRAISKDWSELFE
jgi:hypothetical protein